MKSAKSPINKSTDHQITDQPSLKDLKAAVYDKIAIREAHEREIQKIQQEIGKINHQIADMIRKEEAEKK